MSVIKSRGAEAKESAGKKFLDPKKVIVNRDKKFTQHKVRVLGLYDYVEYMSSGAFGLGIYSQPVSEDSPLLVAYKNGGEDFAELKPRNKFLMAFGSLETGEIIAVDVTKNQANALIGNIEEYKEHHGTVAFNLKKTGESTSTSFALNPILAMSDVEKTAFAKFDGVVVEDEFFELVLQPKTTEFLASLLKQAGFDTDTYLPHIVLTDSADAGETDKVAQEGADEDLLAHI